MLKLSNQIDQKVDESKIIETDTDEFVAASIFI